MFLYIDNGCVGMCLMLETDLKLQVSHLIFYECKFRSHILDFPVDSTSVYNLVRWREANRQWLYNVVPCVALYVRCVSAIRRCIEEDVLWILYLYN